jgi:anti-anti-sigma factor
MPLTIQIEKGKSFYSSEATIIKLIGSLDTATAPELEREMTKTLAGPVSDLVFDLAGLNFVSSAGLRLFSVARKQMTQRGSHATFINLQPQVQEVFAIIQSVRNRKIRGREPRSGSDRPMTFPFRPTTIVATIGRASDSTPVPPADGSRPFLRLRAAMERQNFNSLCKPELFPRKNS